MLKKLFIPHHGNDYKPHFLHHKRICFYGMLFVLIKLTVVGTVLLMPEEAWLSPEVMTRQETEMIGIINSLRGDKQLPALKDSALLDKSALGRAEDMRDFQYFSHTSPSNKKLGDFLQSAGYDYATAGENLAIGFADAQSIVSAWEKSPTHLANLLDPDYQDIGVGVVSGYYNGERTLFTAGHFGTLSGQKIALQSNAARPLLNSAEGLSVSAARTYFDKYLLSKKLLSDWFVGMFEFSRAIYIFFFILFAWVLAINILVEIKRQHPHIIVNTSLLLGLILLFIKF